jgi:hypothetical protein
MTQHLGRLSAAFFFAGIYPLAQQVRLSPPASARVQLADFRWPMSGVFLALKGVHII